MLKNVLSNNVLKVEVYLPSRQTKQQLKCVLKNPGTFFIKEAKKSDLIVRKNSWKNVIAYKKDNSC